MEMETDQRILEYFAAAVGLNIQNFNCQDMLLSSLTLKASWYGFRLYDDDDIVQFSFHATCLGEDCWLCVADGHMWVVAHTNRLLYDNGLGQLLTVQVYRVDLNAMYLEATGRTE